MTELEILLRKEREYRLRIYESEVRRIARSLDQRPSDIRQELRGLGYTRVQNEHGLYLWRKGV